MIEIKIVLGILLMHFIADFLCQTDYMAVNKSKSNKALLLHTSTYSVLMLIGVAIMLPVEIMGIGAVKFAAITLIVHTVQDYITSRVNSKLWADKKVHWFFVSIGFDQLLHYTQLILTYYWLTKL